MPGGAESPKGDAGVVIKQCSHCKQDFECRGETGQCWCHEYAARGMYVPETYGDKCFCPKCLEELAE